MRIPTLGVSPHLADVFKAIPETVWPLLEYHDLLLRGPSPLSVAERELIAVYVSGLNACDFCCGAHQIIAEAAGVDAVVFQQLLQDIDTAPVSDVLKPIFHYVRTLTLSPARATDAQAQAIRDAGWDESVIYESSIVGTLVAGDLGFERDGENASRKSHLSRLLTGELTRIISICPLLNHNQAGVSGHLVGLVDGSMDNSRRFSADASILSVAVPEILAIEDAKQRRHLGDRLVLNITDALFCQYLGQSKCLLHYTVGLGQLRFSTDPVALDVFSIEELKRQRERFEVDYSPPDSALYKNAALIQLGESNPARREVVEIVR